RRHHAHAEDGPAFLLGEGRVGHAPDSVAVGWTHNVGMDDRVSNPPMSATSGHCPAADAPVAPPDGSGRAIPEAAATALPILLMLSTCHLLNDMIQSLLPA